MPNDYMLTELDATEEVGDDDLLYTVLMSTDPPTQAKVTKANLFAGMSGGAGSFTDTYANIPTPSKDGDLFLPSDGFTLDRDTGAAWAPWGPLFPLFEPPEIDTLTWVNQGSGTAVKSKGGIYMYAPGVGGDQLRCLVKSKTPPWKLTVGMLVQGYRVNYSAAGILFRESGSGKIVTNHYAGEDYLSLRVSTWGSASSYSGNYMNCSVLPSFSVLWLQIEDDNVNRICRWSVDGQNWIQMHSVGRTDYITADQAGIFVNSNNSWPIGTTFISWKEE